MTWKSACIGLAMVCAIGLAGCGDDNNGNGNDNGTPHPTSTAARTATPGTHTATPANTVAATPTTATSSSGGQTPTPAGTANGESCSGSTETLTVTSNPGGDLDTGWTGIAHNSASISESKVTVNLNDCDATGQCTVDGSALVGQPFGSPLPLSSGGVPVCVLNTFREAVTGTYNCVSGCGESTVHLTSSVFLVQDIAKPCPTCEGDPTPNDGQKQGTCNGGKAPGAPCDVGGISDQPSFGSTSNDCLPTGSSVGELAIDISPLTTGTVSVTADQQCVSVGSVGQCFCPSQNRPNACDDGVCPDSGFCTSPVDGLCSNQKFRSCSPGSGTADCEDTFPGSGTCTDSPRPCFNSTITRTGQCGTQTGTLVGFFCIPATKAPAINTTAGLPGPGALTLPARSTRAQR